MTPDFTHGMFEERVKTWRRAFLAAAVLVAVQLPIEFHYEAWAVSLPLRLAWVALLLACVPWVRPDRPRLANGLAHLGGFGSGLLASGIIAVTGGSHGPRFGFLLAFPLVVLVMAPDLPWAAGAMGIATTLGGFIIMVRDQQDGWFISEWGILSVTATGLAVLGTLASRRLGSSELRVRAAHAEAVVKLAEAERAASVGRLASAVAHRVSNPLSVVKANLWFLLSSRDARDLDPDAAEMLRESVASVERVARVLTELRALEGSKLETPIRCELTEVATEAVSLLPEREPAVGIQIEFPTDLPSVLVGRQGLLLSMMAVLSNATDSALARDRSDTPTIRVSGRHEGDLVEIRIADRVASGETTPRAATSPVASLNAADHRYAADLAIAREILGRSGGNLDVAATSTGATVVRIRLRVVPTAS